jgi:hypothetical protein
MRLPVVVSVGLLGVVALAAAACSSKPDPNDPSQMQPSGGYGYNNGQYPPNNGYPPNNNGYPPNNNGYPPNNNGYPPNNNGYPPGPTNPTGPTNPPSSGGGSATPIAPAAAAAATPVLQAMAANDARGMNPEGGAFAGQFQQGQTLEQTFNATPGKCYTVVGVGLGLTQLDIMIQTTPPPPIPAMTVAQSNTQGPNATVGGGGNCVKYPLPVGAPAKIVLKATGGSGIAVAQLFSK